MLSIEDQEVIKILLANQDANYLKEIIQDLTSGVTARMESQYDLINYKLDIVDKKVTKTNGSVAKATKDITDLEIKVKTHAIDCPYVEKIEKVYTQTQNIVSIRHFVNRVLVVVSTLVGIGFVIFQVCTKT